MSLARNILTVGGATIASRILGFARDTMIAATLGTGPVADAFLVAFRLPNLFRRLFADGAFNAAFVPLYARTLEGEGPEAARRLAEESFAALFAALLAATGLAMAAAPLLVGLLAPGFSADPEKFALTTALTVICLPFLACMALVGMLGGVLSAHRRFLAVASAPLLMNTIMLTVLVVIDRTNIERSREAGFILSLAVSASGLAQLAFVAVALTRAEAGFRVILPRWTPRLGRLMRLGVPGMVAGGITQLNIVVATVVASLDPGAVSVLYYADRLHQLPLGVVGFAIGLVLLPEIARQVRAGRDDLALHQQNRSLEYAAALTLPAAIALLVIAHPIVEVLFERGAFGPSDTDATAAALAGFAFGLPAFVLVRILSVGFFAREVTHTPMWIAGLALGVNLVLCLVLWPSLHEVGVALAVSVSGWVNAGLLWAAMVRRGFWRADSELERRLPRICGAAAGMGAVLFALVGPLDSYTGAENPLLVKFGALSLLVGCGLAVFVGVAQLLGGIDFARILPFRKHRAPSPDRVPAD
jgi:putative peptidoglycan lipid II flippase